VTLWQIGLVAAFLILWQYLPAIKGLQNVNHVFDPFFVSSPTKVAAEIYDLCTGTNIAPVWSYLWATISAALLGTAIGMLVGGLVALALSGFEAASKVLRPFIVAINATPRIALIPIIVVLFGTTLTTSVVNAFLGVFFVAFFNAYEGGSTVPTATLQNAKLLGASKISSLVHIRLPVVAAWTLASLALAITISLITVVTSELLTGYPGMGELISTATTSVNASLTFAVVIMLGAVGAVVVTLAEIFRRRVLHWWGK
jgi:NitT/TauT family transport system permease protein